ncbi:MAG: hypothetical protein QM775_08695 [Pirellulales bacterium]
MKIPAVVRSVVSACVCWVIAVDGGGARAADAGAPSPMPAAESLAAVLADAKKMLDSGDQLTQLQGIKFIGSVLSAGPAMSLELTKVREEGVKLLIARLHTCRSESNLTAYAAAEALGSAAERVAPIVRQFLVDRDNPISRGVVLFCLDPNSGHTITVDDPVVQGYLAASHKLPTAPTNVTAKEFMNNILFLKAIVTADSLQFPVASVAAVRLMEYTHAQTKPADLAAINPALWVAALDALAAGANDAENEIVQADCARAVAGDVRVATEVTDKKFDDVRVSLLGHLAKLAGSKNPHVAQAAVTGFRELLNKPADKETAYTLRVADLPSLDKLAVALPAAVVDAKHPFVAEQAAMVAAIVAKCELVGDGVRARFGETLLDASQRAIPLARPWLVQALANLAIKVSGTPAMAGNVAGSSPTQVTTPPTPKTEPRFFAGGAGISTASSRRTAGDIKTFKNVALAGDYNGVTSGRSSSVQPRAEALGLRPIPKYDDEFPENQRPGLRGAKAPERPQNMEDGKRLGRVDPSSSIINIDFKDLKVGSIDNLTNQFGAKEATKVTAGGAPQPPAPSTP